MKSKSIQQTKDKQNNHERETASIRLVYSRFQNFQISYIRTIKAEYSDLSVEITT